MSTVMKFIYFGRLKMVTIVYIFLEKSDYLTSRFCAILFSKFVVTIDTTSAA